MYSSLDKNFDELQNEESVEECHWAVNTEPMDKDFRSHSTQQAEDLVEDLDERVSNVDAQLFIRGRGLPVAFFVAKLSSPFIRLIKNGTFFSKR